MRPASMWHFIAGDSKRAPLAVALALAVSIVLVRTPIAPALAGAVFAAIIALGLAASVFERT